MKKNLVTNLKNLVIGGVLLLCGSTFVSCEDEISTESRFTFTGELIADHLENNPEKFSNFCEILKRASIGKKASGNMLMTLSTYGSYTCFAPTNEAIENFLLEQSQIPKSGVTSPYLEDLSDSMATVIAKNHIIEMGYRTIDVNDGNFPQATMSRRAIELGSKEEENGQYSLTVNGNSRIIEKDIETVNGYIQVIDRTLNPTNNLIPDQLAQYKEFSLFSEALKETGWDEKISDFEIDPNYDETQTHPGLPSGAQGTALYPDEWNQRYTLLVESNDLLADPSKNHLGKPITDLAGLQELAEIFYGNEARDNYKDENNALNKFIAYHILDRRLYYKSNSGPGGFIMENYENGKFKSDVNLPNAYDRYDYFETMLKHSIIKVTRPKAETELQHEIVLNYAQEDGTKFNDPAMENYLNVIVLPSDSIKITDFNGDTKNGTIHGINKILIYNETEMSGNVLNERMRWDITSLFPELTNNGVRWDFKTGNHKITYIPHNYCERLRVRTATTDIFYLLPTETGLLGYSNYQGDELLITGQYDFEYRIPYVPTGTYEIRFGYSQSSLRGVIQLYFDGDICGIPVDLRNSAEAQVKIGWFDETDMTPAEILENDKAMRNKGFMKGPASCHLDMENPTSAEGNMRYSVHCIRRIVGTFPLGKKDGGHWLRVKSVTENATTEEFNQDYLEIVPTTVITNINKPEDQY